MFSQNKPDDLLKEQINVKFHWRFLPLSYSGSTDGVAEMLQKNHTSEKPKSVGRRLPIVS